MKPITNKTKKTIEGIISLLKEQGQMHVRGISRALGIHPMTVSRIIDGYLSTFLEINEINEFGLRAKIVKIREDKQNITFKEVIKYLYIRKKIRSSKVF